MSLTKCDNCGVDFKRNPYRLNRNPKHQFCNRKCWLEFLDRRRTGNQVANCHVCNNTITGIPYQKIERNNRYFCSRDCLYIANNEKVSVNCEYCGKENKRVRSQFNKSKHNFCNIICRSAWRSIHFTKEKHPGWKGGHKNPRDYGPSWRRMRALAVKRDDHKCTSCGALKSDNGRNLDVHHIKPFREFGYTRNKNRNDLIANQLSNLITLCRKCHWIAEGRSTNH